MELILIRHLKTPGNEKRQYIGSTDEELSEQEVLNFKKKYKIDSYPQVQQVIVSINSSHNCRKYPARSPVIPPNCFLLN